MMTSLASLSRALLFAACAAVSGVAAADTATPATVAPPAASSVAAPAPAAAAPAAAASADAAAATPKCGDKGFECNKGDTAWMMTSTAFVLLMTVPGLA